MKSRFKHYNIELIKIKHQMVNHLFDFVYNLNDIMDFYYKLLFM